MTLPSVFLDMPLAHRGLHDVVDGRPENSRAAVRAALAHGYGIEIDVQISADGHAMVFHDYALDRLTTETGPVAQRAADDLGRIGLQGGTEAIPTLPEILDLVAGRVPVLIEIKDQDGGMGPDLGALEQAVVAAVEGYAGPVAIMSFNPHSVMRVAELGCATPLGLTTSAFDPQVWPLPETTCATLRDIPDYTRVGASFISHEAADLGRARVAELKAAGAGILTWTITTPEAEAEARAIAQNITFEGYLPPLAG